MNIKEHIEAGHYPTDEKGRALVTTEGGRTATICATDGPSDYPLVGFFENWPFAANWCVDGCRPAEVDSKTFLLPPPPRKVKVKGSFKYKNGNFIIWNLDSDPPCLWKEGSEFTFTGEYEEPWS